ncbi:MAG: hypothetical protein IKS13_05525 [Ruminococcus sp.]|nr:hypothetical protein [Ruminococcus sp.]
MKNIEKMIELFDNPYAMEFLEKNDNNIRYAVTRIAASCELLKDMVKNTSKEDGDEIIENIRIMCRTIIRESALNNVFGFMKKDKRLIDTDQFLEDFAAGCLSILGDKCFIKINRENKGFIYMHEELLRYYLLCFLRKKMLSAPDKALEADVGTEINGNIVTIYLKTESVDAKENSDDTEMLDSFFTENYEVICRAVEEKLNVKIRAEKDAVYIDVPEAETGNELSFRSHQIYFDDGSFSIFNVMLRDIYEN